MQGHELLADHLAWHLREKTGRELPQDLRLSARLEDAAERAKIDLSSQPYARVMEEALAPGLHLDLEIARPTFEALVERQLDGTKPACFLSGGTDSSTVAGGGGSGSGDGGISSDGVGAGGVALDDELQERIRRVIRAQGLGG